jgi:hypothetical protein
MAEALTKVRVLQVLLLAFVGLDLIALLDQMLNKHLGRNCNHKGGIIGAAGDVFIRCDDLLGSSNWSTLDIVYSSMVYSRGRLTWPVYSVGGEIGVMLYGIVDLGSFPDQRVFQNIYGNFEVLQQRLQHIRISRRCRSVSASTRDLQ